MSNIHNNLKQLRLSKNYTQEDVAEKIGVTRQAISSYESGRTQPSIDLLMKFAEIYEVELDEILYGKKAAGNELKRIKVIFCIVVFAWLIFRIMEIGMMVLADMAYQPTEEAIHIDSKILEEAIDQRFEYLDRAATFEALAYNVLWIGGMILLVLDLVMKKSVARKSKWKMIGILMALSLGIGWIGGRLVPLYKFNFMWTVFYSSVNILLLMLIDCVGQWIKHRVRRNSNSKIEK